MIITGRRFGKQRFLELPASRCFQQGGGTSIGAFSGHCETLRRLVDRSNHRTGNYTAQPHHHLLNSSHHHNTTTPDRRHILDNLYPCQLGVLGLLVWHWKCLPLGIGDINFINISCARIFTFWNSQEYGSLDVTLNAV